MSNKKEDRDVQERKIMLDGLLEVDYLVKRMPDARDRILKYQILQREQNILLLKGNLRLIGIQTWNVLKSAFWTGLTVFLLLVTVSQLGSLLRVLEGFSSAVERVPDPIAREIDLASLYDPTGTAWSFASGLPEVTLFQATIVAIITMLLVLSFKGYLLYAHYKLGRRMKIIIADTENEKAVLEAWLAQSSEKD